MATTVLERNLHEGIATERILLASLESEGKRAALVDGAESLLGKSVKQQDPR